MTGLALPEHPASYLLGAVSILLAITVAFLADMMVNLAAFWLLETRGLTVVYNAVMNLLSGGFLIPIVWFPDWLLAIARATRSPRWCRRRSMRSPGASRRRRRSARSRSRPAGSRCCWWERP